MAGISQRSVSALGKWRMKLVITEARRQADSPDAIICGNAMLEEEDQIVQCLGICIAEDVNDQGLCSCFDCSPATKDSVVTAMIWEQPSKVQLNA